MPVEDEDCELEERPILLSASERAAEVATISSTQQELPVPREDSSKKTEGRPSKMPPMIGVKVFTTRMLSTSVEDSNYGIAITCYP
jgi:hypothetical protein